MKKDNTIRKAIDESLSCVHFSSGDVRSVLRAVHGQASVERKPSRRKRRFRFEPAFAALACVTIFVPLSLFAAHTLRSPITAITPSAAQTGDPIANADRVIPLPCSPSPSTPSSSAGNVTKEEAVLAARACFEAQCDTSIFSFEEYNVSVQSVFDYGKSPDDADFVVTMDSIYDNGCTFTVVVSGKDGSVVSHSAPRPATVPERLKLESEEVQAWYAQYGKYLFTWPLDVQAEFSRRYEGALLRMPREDEVDQQTIANRFGLHVYELTEKTGENIISYYIMLYDGQSFADGQARYTVYCFPGREITDTLPDTYMLLTFLAADGSYESGKILSTDSR